MSIKDKLELGLKPDAAFRSDNLPDFQKDDPSCQVAGEPGESGRVQRAREDCAAPVTAPKPRRVSRKTAGRKRAQATNN